MRFHEVELKQRSEIYSTSDESDTASRSILTSSYTHLNEMEDFLHCPNCHYPISQVGREDQSVCPSNLSGFRETRERPDRPASGVTSLGTPLLKQKIQARYIPDPFAAQSKATSPKKGKSIFSFSFPKRVKRPFQRKSLFQPCRPERPLPIQCPPQITTQTKWKAWLESSSSVPFLPGEHEFNELSHDSLYFHDTLRKEMNVPSETDSQSPYSALRYGERDAITPSVTACKIYHDQPSILLRDTLLYSTPPTTASKLALRPSPLRVEQHTPPSLSLDSRFRIPFDPTVNMEGFDHSSMKNLSQASSASGFSKYSSITRLHDSALFDTPPTSPPPLPQRSASRSTVIPVSARQLVRVMRDELGMMNEINEMNSNCDQQAYKTVFVAHDQNQDQKSNIYPAAHQKISPSIKDIAASGSGRNGGQTFLQAVEAVEGPMRRNPNLLQWLSSQQSGSQYTPRNTAIHSKKDDSFSSANSAASASSEALPFSVRQVPSSIERQAISLSNLPKLLPEEPVPTTQPENNNSEAPLSLLTVRRKLYELSDDEDGAESVAKAYNISSASLKKSSKSSDSGIELPLNCRRIEIEWMGKKLPILIHGDGRVLEGPCSDTNCTEHIDRLVEKRV